MLGSDGLDVVPGSGEAGVLAVTRSTGVGYYNDPERTASTFREIDGRRYVVPGDWAVPHADGTITLLGRGSGCINTGGEKVWPEEVEEMLKTHPEVLDALVVGIPDDEWGESVAAVVAVTAPATGDRPTPEELGPGWPTGWHASSARAESCSSTTCSARPSARPTTRGRARAAHQLRYSRTSAAARSASSCTKKWPPVTST